MTTVQASLQVGSQGFLIVTERKSLDPEKSSMLGSMKLPMNFGEEGEDFIDSILSRE